ncbi:MAG: HAMP domain-containing protein [Oligoflexia bacterium]|nr:HAMP domain-containing protein [Oligoflexia bacterium]
MKKSKSIIIKFFLFISSTICIVLLLLAGIINYLNYINSMHELNAKNKTLLDIGGLSLVKPLWDMDSTSISSIGKSIMNAEDIMALEILSDKKEKYYSQNKEKYAKLDFDKIIQLSGHTLYSLDIKGEDNNLLGKIKFISSNENVSASIKKNSLIITLLFFLVFIVNGLVIWITGIKLIKNPLKKLELAAYKLSNGELETQIEVETEDEVGNLAKAFIIMKDSIKEKIRQIEDYSKNLEVKVEERTKELREEMKKVSDLLNNMKQSVFTINKNGIAVPPVSKYSAEIFGEDISQKNIYDFLYKSIDKKSETYSTLNTAMLSVFAGDDLQWMLMEDQFPTKVNYKVDANSDNNRSIRVSYNPIWSNDDKKDSLDRLMLVAEDITAVEKLENEINKQKSENLRRMQILQELAAQSPADLKKFLSDAFKMIDNCFSLLKSLNKDRSGAGTLFRNLHTIKGNSRLFGLNLISQVTHEVESELIHIRANINNSDFNIDEKNNELSLGLKKIYDVLQEYSTYAEKLLKIENEYRIKNLKSLHHLIISFEWAIYNSEINSIQELNANCKELATKLLPPSVINTFNEIDQIIINKANNEMAQIRSDITAKFLIIANEMKNIYIASSVFQHYEINQDNWVDLYVDLYKITSDFILFKEDKNSNKSKLQDMIKNAYEQAEKNDQIFAKYNLAYLDECIKSFSVKNRDQIISKGQNIIRQMWSYVMLVSQLNIYHSTDARQIYRPTENLLSLINNNEANLAGIGESSILYGVLKKLEKENIETTDFFKTFKEFNSLSESDELLIEYFLPKQDNFDSNSIYFDLLDFNLSNNNRESISKLLLISCRSLCLDWEKCFNGISYLCTIDTISLMAAFVNNEETLLSKPNTIDIVDKNIDKLKEFIDEEVRKIPNLKGLIQLKKLSEKLLDVPIKNSLIKYFPMIKDLSARLNKKIKLKIEGQDAMVNRNHLVLILDSLTHILRNAVDHAIEKPEERKLKSKNEEGIILIKILQHDDIVKIEVEDDGAGINVDKLKQKAIQSGLLSIEEISKMDNNLVDLIFYPGLSCKDDANDISGRGIGMDVVKTNIKKIGGSVEIETKAGQGTKFVIKLGEGLKNIIDTEPQISNVG